MSKKLTTSNDSFLSGNTNSGKEIKKHSMRSKTWFITTFDKDERENYHPKTIYDLRCDDTTKPENGNKWHAHILLHFKNQISFNTIKSLFPNGHIEKPKDVYDTIGYIKNNVNMRKSIYKEEGREPINTRFMTVEQLKKIDNPNDLDWKMLNTWEKLHPEEIDVEEWHKDVKVYYISGPSGSGKTEKAKQLIRDKKQIYGSKFSLVKFDGNFWHGVNNKGIIAVYDDFRDSHMKASEFINFIDYNTQRMNIKGGDVLNNYKLIIITSIQPLQTIYKNMTGEPRQQWERRVEEIQLIKNNEEEEFDIDAL